MPSGYRVIALDEVDSTNAHAARLHARGETGPLWIWAGRQTAGRGRRGRHWVSEPGNLYASLLLPLDAEPATAAQTGFVAALAVYDLVDALSAEGSDIRLKWPNDVLLNGKKVSGILSEALPDAPGGKMAIVIGCGINLAHAPHDSRYGATYLGDEGRGPAPSPRQAFQVLAKAFAQWLSVWRTGAGFDDVRNAWLSRTYPPGHPVTLQVGEEKIAGSFAGLTHSGAIVLKDKGGTKKSFHAGEVVHSGGE